jgi:hypothetical protein
MEGYGANRAMTYYIITLYYSLHIGGFTKPNTLHSVITENNTYTAYDIRKKIPTRRVRRPISHLYATLYV